MPVKGIQQVKRNLRVKVEEICDKRTNAAVFAVLHEGAAMADAKTPVDTGNLVDSRYAPQIERQGDKTVGKVGYTAAYAAAVHKAPGKLKGEPRAHFGKTREGVEFGGGTGKGNYWDPSAEPRFLERGFDEIKPQVPAILKRIYKKG